MLVIECCKFVNLFRFELLIKFFFCFRLAVQKEQDAMDQLKIVQQLMKDTEEKASRGYKEELDQRNEQLKTISEQNQLR